MNPRLEVGPDGVAHVTFDDPARRQNVLTVEALAALDTLIEDAEAAARSGALRVLVFRSAKPGSFIAGVDLAILAGMSGPDEASEGTRRGQALFGRIAALPAPTVAAVSGVCLGGGTELALACDVRLADDDERTRIGLPEVRLGILPALGGATRLPRLVGLSAALDLMLSGRPASASKARRIGLVDGVLPRRQFEERVGEAARGLAEAWDVGSGGRAGRAGYGGKRRRRGPARWLLDSTPPGRALVLRAAHRKVLRRTKGFYPAPLAILDVAGKGLGRSMAASLELEAEAAGRLAPSPECKNLLHIFNLDKDARKGPWAARGGGSEAARRLPPRRVWRLAVVGAGPMGGGIAQVAAYRDIPVRLKDIRHEAVAAGLAHARGVFDGAVRRKRLRRRDADRKMALVSGAIDYSGVGCADIVVEAVVERMEVKRAVLAEVEAVAGDEAVIATNTSSLSVGEMASDLRRPERFAGMHFFNPVHRMPLVEIVPGPETSARTVETLAALAVRLGKAPVITRDAPGFLVNRILGPFLNEAGHLLDEGWDAVAIDEAWKRFGMPMGPYRLIDEIGSDVVAHAGRAMAAALGKRMTPAAALVRLAGSGRLGRKGERGFYRYARGGRARGAGFDPTVYGDLGLPRRRAAPDRVAIRDRLLLPMVNEAARVLREGVVASAGEVDLGMVMGTGFPPFRGGLLRYADARGVAGIRDSMERMARAHGDRHRPSRLVVELAEAGRSFYGR